MCSVKKNINQNLVKNIFFTQLVDTKNVQQNFYESKMEFYI